MKQRDENILTMWRTVRQLLDSLIFVWNKLVPFNDASNELTEAITRMKIAMDAQRLRTQGFTNDRELKDSDAVEKVMLITNCAKAHALSVSDPILLDTLKISKSSLLHLTQNQLTSQLRSMLSAAEMIADDLVAYGINEQTFESAREAIHALEERQTNIRTAITGKRAITESIPEIMKFGQKSLAKMDSLIHLFTPVDAEFVLKYRAARRIVHTGKRHNNAKGDDTAVA